MSNPQNSVPWDHVHALFAGQPDANPEVEYLKNEHGWADGLNDDPPQIHETVLGYFDSMWEGLTRGEMRGPDTPTLVVRRTDPADWPHENCRWAWEHWDGEEWSPVDDAALAWIRVG
jgi:hypothetical protein